LVAEERCLLESLFVARDITGIANPTLNQ